MKALVTGASSGIGYEIAKILDAEGYEVIVTGRNMKMLQALAAELKHPPRIIQADLSKREECLRLFKEAGDVDVVINNAGAGVHGAFHETALSDELSMLDINVTALHILTKLYYLHFKKEGSGYIMNVASSAAFFAGPYFASYYASKAYVLRLTCAIYEELRQMGSHVSVSVLCPGPVDTEFNQVADVKFSVKALSSPYVARYGIDKMFQKKLLIIPGFTMKLSMLLSKFVPLKLLLPISYRLQKRKSD